MEFDNFNREFSGGAMLISAVTELRLNGKSMDAIAEYLSIDKGSALFISKLTADLNNAFCDFINSRKVVKCVIQFEKIITAAERIQTMSDASLEKNLASANAKMRRDYSVGYHFKRMATQYMVQISGRHVGEYSDFSASKVPDMPLPEQFIKAVFKLTNEQTFLLGCYMHIEDLVKIEVDKNQLTFAINGFAPRLADMKLVQDLIQCGANYNFIKEHNNRTVVTLKAYERWRKVYEVGSEKEVLSVTEQHDLMRKYDILTKAGMEFCDIYFELYRTFRGKFRIETLYMKMNALLAQQIEEDDDDDDDIDLASLLN